MKVLQINATYGYGSTGIIMKDIGQAAEQTGFEAYFAYQKTNEPVANGYCIGNKMDWKLHALLCRLFGKQAYFSKRATKKFFRYMDKLQPDVVHLHNLHSNYIHLNLLLEYLAKKDIATVITLHDCWYFTGKCFHYIDVGCGRFQSGCGNCPKKKAAPQSLFFDTSAKILKDRQKYLLKIPRLKIVGCSDWISKEARKSILKNTDITTVWNGVNIKTFKPRNNEQTSQINHCENKFVIMGMANKLMLPSNRELFQKLVDSLNDHEVLLIVGCSKNHQEILKKYSNKVHIVGFVSDRDELAGYYSLADVFINPTHADTLPTVNMESICCGTPVITYDVCGSTELILAGCGAVVSENDTDGMIFAIKSVVKNNCDQAGFANFDKNTSYLKYIDIYKNIIKYENGI